MATPESLEMTLAPGGEELEVLNDVVQLLSWHVLRQCFLRPSDKSSEVNFSDILRGKRSQCS